jgi:hypothetical protein
MSGYQRKYVERTFLSDSGQTGNREINWQVFL